MHWPYIANQTEGHTKGTPRWGYKIARYWAKIVISTYRSMFCTYYMDAEAQYQAISYHLPVGPLKVATDRQYKVARYWAKTLILTNKHTFCTYFIVWKVWYQAILYCLSLDLLSDQSLMKWHFFPLFETTKFWYLFIKLIPQPIII